MTVVRDGDLVRPPSALPSGIYYSQAHPLTTTSILNQDEKINCFWLALLACGWQVSAQRTENLERGVHASAAHGAYIA